MYRLKAKDLMATELITLDKSETLDLADEIMRLARVRHLPVLDEGRLAGLVTHRDILRAQVSALAGLSRDQSRELEAKVPVTEIMTSGVRSVAPDTPAVEVARLMRDHKFGCVPVVEGDRLVGIVTEADFLDLVVRALDDAAPKATPTQRAGASATARGATTRGATT